MLPLQGNWTVEQTNTTGTGNITLSGADLGFARFQDSVPAGEVWYAIQDGTSKEAGIGTFNGNNTLVRTQVTATLQGGIYNSTNPTPLNLTGNAIVACTINSKAFELLDLKEDGLGNPPVDGYVLSSDTLGNRLWVPNNTGTLDHDQLNNRDLVDQHPIASITGLTSELNLKENNLGLPAVNAYVLASDTLGNRFWTENTGPTSSNDHTLLINRDSADQHPMDSITGLPAALSAKEDGLGFPVDDGYILSSTIAGVRSWIPNSGTGGTFDHNDLINRDTADQHIIGAITGLQAALDNKSDITHLHPGVYEPANANIQAHIADNTPDVSNPHNITKATILLDQVDNTSDLDKPISTATQTALDLKEDSLGNPIADGYVLSSTTLGARSWVNPQTGINDHAVLINKDLADQHPISAITNLQTSLDAKLNHTNGVGTGLFDTVLVTPLLDIDVSASNWQTKTITGDSVFTFSGWTTDGGSVLFELTTTTGTELVTFTGANFKTAPTLAAGINRFIFTSNDNGVTIYGETIRDGS